MTDDGKLRAFAVAAPNRIDGWPDVPTFTELGYNIDLRGFVGLSAPAKTPKPIVDFLNKKLNEVVQSDAVQVPDGGARHDALPAADNTPEKFDKFMRDEIVRQGEMAKLSGPTLPAA